MVNIQLDIRRQNLHFQTRPKKSGRGLFILSALIFLLGLGGVYLWQHESKSSPAARLKAKHTLREWKTYTNSKLGYSLKYPGNCRVIKSEQEKIVEFIGPHNWPKLTLKHPDSNFYRPPAGTQVQNWVKVLRGRFFGPEFKIAGLPTAHLIQASTKNSCGTDNFYFINRDRLFCAQITHSGNQKDWKTYYQFLESIRFRI